MAQTIGNQQEFAPNDVKVYKDLKNTQNAPERVGDVWPPLLTKKWLAIYYGCWDGSKVCYKRFRRQVLTPEVLEKAGISQKIAYSVSTKTFNAIDSMLLTKVLRGFCLIAVLMLANAATAQTPLDFTYSRDTILRDTFPGMAMVTDSTVRMVSTKRTGEYRYESVLGTVCVEAIMVKEYRYLVKANDGGLDPFDIGQKFFLITGGEIDPKRLFIFKQHEKRK